MPRERMDIEIRAKNLASRALKDIQREMSMLGRSSANVTRSIISTFGLLPSCIGVANYYGFTEIGKLREEDPSQ